MTLLGNLLVKSVNVLCNFDIFTEIFLCVLEQKPLNRKLVAIYSFSINHKEFSTKVRNCNT